MFFSNVDFNVIYVDPSIEEAGDGTTPTTALSNLPQTLGEFVNDSCFIIRRTSEDYAVNLISGTSTLITNVLFLGNNPKFSLTKINSILNHSDLPVAEKPPVNRY